MNLEESLKLLPDTKGCVVILSGGLDSSIATRLAVEKYGKENVTAISFNYGQRQQRELTCAQSVCAKLQIDHKLIDLALLGKIARGFSANVDRDLEMPTIRDVLGDPRPKTYVPNRNMIMLAIAASLAEVKGVDTLVCGLQVHDEYSYHDTTQAFVDKMNATLAENRIIKIKIIAPFVTLSKEEELRLLIELDGDVSFAVHTFTCYDPDTFSVSCGKCPSCSERIMNFAKVGVEDPIWYQDIIPWEKLIVQHRREL